MQSFCEVQEKLFLFYIFENNTSQNRQWFLVFGEQDQEPEASSLHP